MKSTIGKVAKEFGLSRGTLLHYDAIGLLQPSMRSDSRYRLYSEADVERLQQICRFREAGVPLSDIGRLLDVCESAGYTAILRRRLMDLSQEIAALRRQQHLIVRLLRPHGNKEKTGMLDKEQWVALMRATGLSDDDMHRWHKEFEKISGEAHEEFLVSLGIGAEEVKQIRQWSGQ